MDLELLRDISIQLAARWHEGNNTYDTPGHDPLEYSTSLLKPNKPLNVIVLSRSDKVYLKYNNNIICFSSSSWVGHDVSHIPQEAKWSTDPKVIFDALVNLLGEGNVPIEPIIFGAGLQHWPDLTEPEANEPVVPNLNTSSLGSLTADDAIRKAARDARHY